MKENKGLVVVYVIHWIWTVILGFTSNTLGGIALAIFAPPIAQIYYTFQSFRWGLTLYGVCGILLGIWIIVVLVKEEK